jgi:hypothetical protein
VQIVASNVASRVPGPRRCIRRDDPDKVLDGLALLGLALSVDR